MCNNINYENLFFYEPFGRVFYRRHLVPVDFIYPNSFIMYIKFKDDNFFDKFLQYNVRLIDENLYYLQKIGSSTKSAIK